MRTRELDIEAAPLFSTGGKASENRAVSVSRECAVRMQEQQYIAVRESRRVMRKGYSLRASSQ